MNKANLERFERINALVREEKDLSTTMSEMTEQCDRIRKYCLDALEDMKAVLDSVMGIVIGNPNVDKIFGWSYDCEYRSCGVYGYNNACFSLTVNEEKNSIMIDNLWITKFYGQTWEKTHVGGEKNAPTITGNSAISNNSKTIAACKKRIEKAKTIESLVQLQKEADTTKLFCESLLKILEEHIKNRVDALHTQIRDGIHAASLDYKKIGD